MRGKITYAKYLRNYLYVNPKKQVKAEIQIIMHL